MKSLVRFAFAGGLAIHAVIQRTRGVSFRGRVVLVTGGSRGLKLVLARQLGARLNLAMYVIGAFLMALPRNLNAQVTPLPTAESAILGRFARGPVNLPVLVGESEFATTFGASTPAAWPAEVQAHQFFANGGTALHVIRIADTAPLAEALTGRFEDRSGLYALAPLSNLRVLIAPEVSLLPVASFVSTFASFRSFLEPRRVFFIVDSPPGLGSAADVINWVNASLPTDAAFCALYFPYLQVLLDGDTQTVPASGAMAAIYATRDASGGVWRSPAGTTLPLQATGLSPALTAADLDALNTNHICSIRQFSGTGIVPWGARTLDRLDTENQFIAVVRTRQWVAASLERSLAFAAVADNAPPLWTQISTLALDFLHTLYQQGAFAGASPAQAYFARCDATTTTASDIAAHRVNVMYGMALLRASEFDLTLLTAATYDSQRPVSVPVLQPRQFADELLVAYPTVAGFEYLLESRAAMDSGSWQSVGGSVQGDGAWRRPGIAITSDRGFCRLRITPAR